MKSPRTGTKDPLIPGSDEAVLSLINAGSSAEVVANVTHTDTLVGLRNVS
jgi:hypothetical protein